MSNQKEEKMKTYRLGYDYLFLPNKSFSYKGDYIGAMSINVLFQVFDENGKEKLFESKDLDDKELFRKDGRLYYLSDFLSCSFDRETIFHMDKKLSLIKESGYTLQWKIDSYFKDLDKGMLYPTEISDDEFMDIMRNHKDEFDNIDNYPTQTVSYFTKEVDL